MLNEVFDEYDPELDSFIVYSDEQHESVPRDDDDGDEEYSIQDDLSFTQQVRQEHLELQSRSSRSSSSSLREQLFPTSGSTSGRQEKPASHNNGPRRLKRLRDYRSQGRVLEDIISEEEEEEE